MSGQEHRLGFCVALFFFFFMTTSAAVADMGTTTYTTSTNSNTNEANVNVNADVHTNVKVRFYFIRHGESAANKWGLLAGQNDVPLTPGGIQEAQALGSKTTYIRDTPFWRAYASDLVRAKDTAVHALEAGGRREVWKDQLQLDAQLRERSYGARQGFSRNTTVAEALTIWESHGVEPPPYETDEDLWERAKQWILQVLHDAKTTVEELGNNNNNNDSNSPPPQVYHVLVASHAGIVREVLLHLVAKEQLDELGANYDAARNHRLIIPNTSVTILEMDPLADQPLERANVNLLELTNANHLEQDVNIYDD
jgi:broad specificity phosphatase PhoE